MSIITATTNAQTTDNADRSTADEGAVRFIRPIATAIMTAGFGFFGSAKIVGAELLADATSWSRLTETQWAMIGALEVLAVVALLAALSRRFRALGVAAATGLATLAACAVVFHVVNGDPAGDIIPAVLQGLVATTYAITGRNALSRR